MLRLIVRSQYRRQPEPYGYVGTERVRIQQLGYRTIFGRFRVLDEEIVPNDIDISLGALGDGGRPWESKFKNWIE